MKEALRMDGPAVNSIFYGTKEEVTICGITIPKDALMSISLAGLHYNKKEWQKPLEFIPERFDPDSKYFKTPEGQSRDPLSFVPFSYGARKCPGQVLAMLELKIFVSNFILSVDYSVDPDLLANDFARLSNYSNFKLKIKLDKILA